MVSLHITLFVVARRYQVISVFCGFNCL